MENKSKPGFKRHAQDAGEGSVKLSKVHCKEKKLPVEDLYTLPKSVLRRPQGRTKSKSHIGAKTSSDSGVKRPNYCVFILL